MDSWWYFKGLADGVKNYTAQPSVFPNGLDNLHQKTGWPFSTHNRYWAGNTDYAKANGGQFDFIIEGAIALPQSSEFFDQLFKDAAKWGLTMYIQDWQNEQFGSMK